MHRHQKTKWRLRVKGRVELAHKDRDMNEVVLCRIFPPSTFQRGKKRKKSHHSKLCQTWGNQDLIHVTGQICQSLERWGLELCPFTYIPFRHHDREKSSVRIPSYYLFLNLLSQLPHWTLEISLKISTSKNPDTALINIWPGSFGRDGFHSCLYEPRDQMIYQHHSSDSISVSLSYFQLLQSPSFGQ